MKPFLLLLSSSLVACVWTQDLGEDVHEEPPSVQADVSCLGTIDYDPPLFETATAIVTVLSLTSPADTIIPVADAQIRVCGEIDLECATPLYETSTAEDGVALVQLPLDAERGFLGYIETQRVSPDFANLRYFVPHVRGQEELFAHALSRVDEKNLYAAVGSEPNPALGTIGLRVVDCGGKSGAGLVVELDDGTVEYKRLYFNQQEPDEKRTETDSFGQVVIFDVPDGKHTIRSRAGDDVMGEAEILVRKGVVTTLFLPPTPPLPW